MEPILEIRNVTKRYSNHTAVSDVSITVPKQSIYGLLGPNGAGKTSLIRIINQITAPDSGEILFNGERLNPKHVDFIGYLPEERGLYKKMPVGEQALYLAQLKGLKKAEAKKRLKYWFEKFEMQTWWSKKVDELSKGMQQKVQFIVTILHEPTLLILDEPFSGFDPINAQLIRNEILELRKKGSTVIFSTHNMSSVEELCDHIALMNKSQKILDGSVKDIRKSHKNSIFRISFKGNLVGFTNAMWTSAELLDKGKEDDDVNWAVIKIAQDVKSSSLLQELLPIVEIVSFNEVIPSMNDIFISNVNKENNVVGTASALTE
ncbi:MAG TPA: ABC transporter ATP-binding protein [Bacteroidia bacterium]|jgi:ABC-2 type transport system ATP-binding protein|nr:ABC transporter ATP-binding protein [Bacteroidia bacterium]